MPNDAKPMPVWIKKLIKTTSFAAIIIGLVLIGNYLTLLLNISITFAQDIQKSPLYRVKDAIIEVIFGDETDRFIRKNIDQAIDKGFNFLDPARFLDHPDMDQTEWTIFKVFSTNFLDKKPELKKKIEGIYYRKIFTADKVYPEKFKWEFYYWDKSYSLKEFPYAQAVLNYPFLQSPLTKKGEVTPRTEFFMRGFFCQEVPYTKEMLDYATYELPKLDNYRYELTHALMVLQIAKENNCFDPNEIKKSMDILALKIKEETPKILSAMKQGQISALNYYDIFAEMTAFLALADYPQYIDKIWIKEIIERQNKDGGWSIHGRAGEASKSHGAVVSLLALLPYKQYYLDKKPNNFGWLKELPIKEHLSQNQKISESLKKELRKNFQARVMIKYKNTADFIKIAGKIKKPLKNIKAKHLLTNLSSFEIESLKNDPAIELMALDYPIKADLIESLDLIEYNDFKGKYSYSGKGVKLCLVDSGIDQNEFSYIAGYDFVNEDAIPEDESGHGTLVAKIIKSIAPDADLIVAKVLDKNNVGFSSNLLRAFDFCKAQGAKIINLSLGGGSFDGFCDAEPVSQALNQLALENNIFSVASAGNDGLDNNLAMPACASQVFSVGAVDKKDKIASFSNRSVLLDMFAPGENLNIQGKSYSGTSFSAPFVSSAGALLLEKEPLISLSDLKNRLKSSGDPISYYFHNDKIIPISQVFAPYNNQVIQIARLNILNFIENKQTLASFDYSWYWQTADQEIVGVTGMVPVSTQQISTDQFSTGVCAPGGISNLAQFKNDCSSSFSGTCPGASCWTNQTTVCFKGNLTMGGNTSVKMDVEYILSSSSFTNTPNASSSNCSANCTATATSGTLTSGSTYKWQARNNGDACSSNWLTFNSGNAAFTVDTGAPSCSISSISESSSQMYVSGTTLYYNNNSGTGTFTVNSSASDSISGVQKVNFPNTVSNGGDATTSPYSWIYSWDTAATFSSSATVTCYDNATNSATANFTVTRDITAPTSLFISYTNGYITTTTNQITFSASDGGAGVASYTLFYRSATLSNNSCGSFGSWTSLGNQTSPFNHTVSSGNCYQYYMTATDNVNNSASTSQSPTATTKVDTTAPDTPSISYTNGYITTTTNQITFSSSDAESGIASYTLFYRSATLSNNSCGSFGSWTSLGNQTSPFNHTVSSGNCYQYYVTATNNAGLSTSSSQSPTATTKVDTTAPDTPSISYTNGYITTTTNQITFSSSDAESGIASYTLYYRSAGLSNDSCGSFGSWTSLGNQTSPFNHTVTSGNCYQYYVTATNNAGLSTSSSQSPTATTKVDTTGPSGGSVNDGVGADIDEQTDSSTASANWSGFSDNESNLRPTNTYEYHFRRQIDAYFWNGSTWQAATSSFWTTSTSTTLSGLNLNSYVNYYFQVRAYNNANVASNYVSSDGFTIPPSISFSLSASTINLGTLLTSQVSTSTMTMSASTNAFSGYIITVSGNTLTHTLNPSYNIDAITSTASSSPGTEQFGFNLTANTLDGFNCGSAPSGGLGQPASGYNLNSKFKFVSGDIIAKATEASATTTFSICYMANISPASASGGYSTTLTFIMTSTY